MGLIKLGKTIKGYIAKVSGSGLLSQWVSVEELKGFQQKAQVFGGVNEDSSPAQNTQTIDVPVGRDRGFLASVAYRNQQIAPVATEGESRKYSTNAEGDTVQAEVFLHDGGRIEIKNSLASLVVYADGTIETKNSDAGVKLSPDGTVEISNAGGNIKIIPAGDSYVSAGLIITGDTYSALGDMVAGSISLKGHTHPQSGGGNTGAPNP